MAPCLNLANSVLLHCNSAFYARISMKYIKFCTVLSLAAICMAFIPSQSEARGHHHGRSRVRGNVAVGVVAGPYCGPYYQQNTVIVRRPYPTVVERVYVQQPDYCPTREVVREVVVVEQPCYEEVVYVQPRPIIRPSFSFGLSLFR